MSITEKLLGMTVDSSGNRTLVGAVFEGKQFSEFVLGPARDITQTILIERTVFRNCMVEGVFEVDDGVTLRDVEFDNVSSPDSLTISTSAVLDRVTVKGRPKQGGLWIKPFEDFDLSLVLRERAQQVSASTEFMLSIVDYWGPDVEILGLPIEKVIYDPARHVAVYRNWERTVNWDVLKIPSSSYWRICLLRLHDFDVEVGIFDLPGKGQRRFEQTMREMSQLKEAGVL